MAATLNAVFSPFVLIGDIVKTFDFTSIDTSKAEVNDGLTVGLAPALGGLTKDTVKDLSDPCKIMLAGTLRILNTIPPEQRNYQRILAELMQNQLMSSASDGITRSDRMHKQGTKIFNIGYPSPSEPICKEAQAWFNGLIQDPDVLSSTNIDADIIARVVLTTGHAVESFKQLLVDNESVEKTLLDICVLRFPDVSFPVFKVYRIKLVAWSQHKRVLALSEDSHGITGILHCHAFKPRMSVIDSLADNIKQQAIAEAEAIFN